MMTPWVPFPTARRLQLRALLSTVPRSLEELTRLRAQVSGRAVPLTALEALCAREAGFAGRLFGRVLPSVFAHACTLLDRDSPTLPIHAPGVAARAVLSRRDVAGWVAHMVLGTLPDPGPLHPDVDFARLLEGSLPQQHAKLRCVFEYFDRVVGGAPAGRFEVERRVVAARTSLEWSMDGAPLTELVVDERGTIEDAERHLQVDFANAFLGGGVLRTGCVQEEIRFAVAPEHLAAMIVSPRMRDDEAIVMRGAERFALTRGYAQTLEYAGPLRDPAPREADGTPDVDFVAIDAIDYRRGDPAQQFGEEAMLRELGKARAGFLRDARALPVATGNWGCGAFRGHPPLKAVIQWIAASTEGRALRYCTFGDARVGDLEGFAGAARARGLTAGALWQRLRVSTDDASRGLYDRILAR